MALECPIEYAAAEALSYNLENYGITLVVGRAATYSLQQVEDALKKILGAEANLMIMNQLLEILEEK